MSPCSSLPMGVSSPCPPPLSLPLPPPPPPIMQVPQALSSSYYPFSKQNSHNSKSKIDEVNQEMERPDRIFNQGGGWGWGEGKNTLDHFPIGNRYRTQDFIEEIGESHSLFEPLRQILTQSKILRRQVKYQHLKVIRIGCKKQKFQKGTFSRNRRFYLRFENGGLVHVDYTDCFEEDSEITQEDLEKDVQHAMRQAVQKHFQRKKTEYWKTVSRNKIKVPLEMIKNSSAEYKEGWTLKLAIQKFFEKYSIEYETMILCIEAHGSQKKKISDETILSKWKSFHKEIPLEIKILSQDREPLTKLVQESARKAQQQKQQGKMQEVAPSSSLPTETEITSTTERQTGKG